MVGLVLILLNWVLLHRRVARLTVTTPERAAGYRTIERALLIYFVGAAMIFSVGTMLGISHTSAARQFHDSVMKPKPQLTWFDWAFWALWWLVLCRFTFWLYVRAGAEFLVQHRDMFDTFPKSAKTVRIVWFVVLAVSAISFIHLIAG